MTSTYKQLIDDQMARDPDLRDAYAALAKEAFFSTNYVEIVAAVRALICAGADVEQLAVHLDNTLEVVTDNPGRNRLIRAFLEAYLDGHNLREPDPPRHYLGLLDAGIVKGPRKFTYGIWFPDLPGCYASGGTLDEVYRDAILAVLAWMDDAVNLKQHTIPRPRDLADLLQDEGVNLAIHRGGAIIAIPVRVGLEP